MTKEEEAYVREYIKKLKKMTLDLMKEMIAECVTKTFDEYFASPEYKKYGITEQSLGAFFEKRNKEKTSGRIKK